MAASKALRRPIPPKPGSIARRAASAPAATGLVRPGEPTGALPLLRTSERGQFKRCHQRWEWGSVEGLVEPGPPDIKLWFGTGWHLVMAHLYCGPGAKRGAKPHDVWKEYVGDLLLKIRINKRGEDWSHEPYVDAEELGHQMIDAYLERYGQKPDPHWYVLEPEFVGFVIIPRPGTKTPMVQYAFTYDLTYRDEEKGDSVWLGEHKTAKQIQVNHLDLDDQAGSYWATATHRLRATGMIGKTEMLSGIMYNFVRKAPPDERPLHTDGYTHNKPKKEHYIAAFQEAGISEDEYQVGRGIAALKRLAEIASEYDLNVVGDVSKNQPVDNFKRHPVHRTRAEIRSQIQKIQNEFIVIEKFRNGELPITKTATKDCHWDCPFYKMCLLHERGSDWEEYRDAVYVHGDPYEPYRKSATEGIEE